VSTTNASRALEDIAFKALTDEPTLGPALQQIRKRLQQGGYDWSSAFFQKYDNSVGSIGDIYGFAQGWGHLMSGHIGHCEINVHNEPMSDSDVAGNQLILDENLPFQFQATVDPSRGNQDGRDGCLSWQQPLELTRTFVGEDDIQRAETWFCEPRDLALEIGTTDMATTLLHLRSEMGVARWAYGSEKIIVLASHPSLHNHVHSGSMWNLLLP
jgi:hypothetical protein